MTIAARWNLQHGVPENKTYTHTNYNIESELDAYILAKVQLRNSLENRIILNPAAYNALMDQAAADIEKKLDDLFKDFH